MTPQNVPHFLSRLYKRRSIKSCTRVHAYRRSTIHWWWSLSAGYTTKFLHLGVPRNTTQAESQGFEGLVILHLLSHTKYCMTVVVTHVIGVILDVEFDENIHFYVQLTLRSRSGQSGQMRLNRQTQNVRSETCLYCPVLPQDSKKWHLLWCTTIRNIQKLYFKNIKDFVTALLRNSCAQVKFFSLRDVLWIRSWMILKPLA